MRIYYYNIGNFDAGYKKWQEGKFPGHTLYGLTHFQKYGIDTVIHHPQRFFRSRLLKSIYTLKTILLCKEKYDVFYATMFYGAELLIFLRALGIYRKPIVIWHHSSVITPSNKIRRWLSRFFYKGIDELFFFSQRMLDESLQTGKVKCGKVIHWGSDLAYYDKKNEWGDYFISTGKENRDFSTLIGALKDSNVKAEVYIPAQDACAADVESSHEHARLKLHVVNQLVPLEELAYKEAGSLAILIPTLETAVHYPVGLTSLVEAMAQQKAIITTNNPYSPIDVEKEGIGIKVAYGDKEGWMKAFEYVSSHREIAREWGLKARKLAEEQYNLENCMVEMVTELVKWAK